MFKGLCLDVGSTHRPLAIVYGEKRPNGPRTCVVVAHMEQCKLKHEEQQDAQ